jgi:hypothetical protein
VQSDLTTSVEIIFWTVQRRDYHDIDSKIVEDTIV